MSSINAYGDERRLSPSGLGVDVATQRSDDLDQLAIEHLRNLQGPGLALDVGCGHGGQSMRMIATGATVIGVDIHDPLWQDDFDGRLMFCLGDMRNLALLIHPPRSFDVIVCQRAIHYLRFREATDVVRQMYQLLADGGRLFLSASGLDSELGAGYVDFEFGVGDRFVWLAADMAEKHGIHERVCLYREDDLRGLLQTVGFKVERLFCSPFGNVKAVALRGPGQ